MGAFRGTSKIMQRCPSCGGRRPKELVEGERQFHTVAFVVVFFLTCGLGLIAFPAFFSRPLVAYCDRCGATFYPASL
jgi:hypothetical protein